MPSDGGGQILNDRRCWLLKNPAMRVIATAGMP